MCVLRYPPGASRVSPESGDGAGDPGAVGDQSQRTEDRVPLQCSPKSDEQPRPSSHSRRHYSKRLTHRLHSTRAERPHWAPDLPTQSPMSSPKPPPRLRRRQQSTGNIGLYVEESQEISVRISGEFFSCIVKSTDQQVNVINHAVGVIDSISSTHKTFIICH